MSENIKKQAVDIDEMVKEDLDKAMHFAYFQYHLATDQMVRLSQSSRHI